MANKVAFVTGSGRGMGESIALQLASKGVLVVVADINLDNAKKTVEQIEKNGGSAFPVLCDVTNLNDVNKAVEKGIGKFGKIDILVNNAGWEKVEPFLESEPETWERVININYLGTVHTSKALLPHMIKNKRGKIINIASDAGRVGSLGEAVYSGAKGAVIAFSKTVAREMARYQINVNCIAPGPTETPLFDEMVDSSLKGALKKSIPFRRLAQPEDIAKAVTFFASNESDYITGQTLSVSGGLTMV